MLIECIMEWLGGLCGVGEWVGILRFVWIFIRDFLLVYEGFRWWG